MLKVRRGSLLMELEIGLESVLLERRRGLSAGETSDGRLQLCVALGVDTEVAQLEVRLVHLEVRVVLEAAVHLALAPSFSANT